MLKNLPSGSIQFNNDKLFVLDSSNDKRELDDFIYWKFDSEIENLLDELKDIFHFCDVRFSDYLETIPDFIKKWKDKRNASVKANIMKLISKMEKAKNLSELNFAYNELISIIKGVHRFLVIDKGEVNEYLNSYIRGVHNSRNVVLGPGGIVEDYLLLSGQSVREFRESFVENYGNKKKIIIEYIQTLHAFLQEKILFMKRADRVEKSGVSEKKIRVRPSDIDNNMNSKNEKIETSNRSTYKEEHDTSDADFSESDIPEMYFYDLTKVPLKKFDNLPENDREIAYKIIIDEKTLYAKETELDKILSKIDICERWLKFILTFPDDTYIRYIDIENIEDIIYIESIMNKEVPITCSSDVKGASSVSEQQFYVSNRIEALKTKAKFLKSEIDFLKENISFNCKMLSSKIEIDEIDNLIGRRREIHR